MGSRGIPLNVPTVIVLAVRSTLTGEHDFSLSLRDNPACKTNIIVSCSAICKAVTRFFFSITTQQILDSSKLKDFADNNFKFDKNGTKLSKQVENTVGKAISPFPTVFSKSLFPRGLKRCHCVRMG